MGAVDRRIEQVYAADSADFIFIDTAGVGADPKMTTALLDRLTHRCHILETGAERSPSSSRLSEAQKSGELSLR